MLKYVWDYLFIHNKKQIYSNKCEYTNSSSDMTSFNPQSIVKLINCSTATKFAQIISRKHSEMADIRYTYNGINFRSPQNSISPFTNVIHFWNTVPPKCSKLVLNQRPTDSQIFIRIRRELCVIDTFFNSHTDKHTNR